jgi:hypothetical protein
VLISSALQAPRFSAEPCDTTVKPDVDPGSHTPASLPASTPTSNALGNVSWHADTIPAAESATAAAIWRRKERLCMGNLDL